MESKCCNGNLRVRSSDCCSYYECMVCLCPTDPKPANDKDYDDATL